MTAELWVPARMPGLNDIINKKRNMWGKGRGDAYGTMKRSWAEAIVRLATGQGLGEVGPGHYHYLFVEEDRRRDPSNVVAGGVKILEDALQDAGVIPNDGWDQVLGIHPYWARLRDVYVPGAAVGVLLVIRDEGERVLRRDEMIDIYQGKMKDNGEQN